MIQDKQRRVFAKFKRGAAPYWAQQIGIEMFEMRDRPPEIEPSAWLCAYDSDADEWDAEEKAEVDRRLLELGYLRVEKPRLKAPYQMFDQHRKTAQGRNLATVIKDIEHAYATAGFNIADAVAYERENGNDDKVVAALEALRGPEDVAADPLDDVIAA